MAGFFIWSCVAGFAIVLIIYWMTRMTAEEEKEACWAREICAREFATRPERSRKDHWFRKLVLWSPFGLNLVFTASDELYLARLYLYPRKLGLYLSRRHYLHCLWRSDDPVAWHNHPWEDSTSRILEAGYLDHRLEPAPTRDAIYGAKAVGGVQNTYQRLVGDHVPIGRHTFHRIELIDGHAWTLFMPGKRVSGPDELSWGFIKADTGRYIPWKPYVMQKRKQAPEA